MNSQTSVSLQSPLLLLMTFATGLCVGSLYYCQPLLHQIQESFKTTPVVVGLIPTLTQLGYALGMVFFIPLGDMYEKRRLIFLSTLLSAVALLLVALAKTVSMVIVASLLIGLTTMAPQYIIPFVANLSDDRNRGKNVGMIMSGLLLGILLSRTVSGFVGSAIGWRGMYFVAAGVLGVFAFILLKTLPTSPSSFSGSYFKLLKSVFTLVRTQPVLRESMIFGGSLFAAFSAFWAALIFLMESPAYGLGAKTAGLFGVIGASGALAAPLVGRYADRSSPRQLIGWGILMVGLSYAVFWAGGHLLWALALGVLLMDVGVQVAHVCNQSRFFALVPDARSRINTAYMFAYFVGGALGSWLSSWAWDRFGWSGVCAVALGFVSVAAGTYFKKNSLKTS